MALAKESANNNPKDGNPNDDDPVNVLTNRLNNLLLLRSCGTEDRNQNSDVNKFLFYRIQNIKGMVMHYTMRNLLYAKVVCC